MSRVSNMKKIESKKPLIRIKILTSYPIDKLLIIVSEKGILPKTSNVTFLDTETKQV